MQLDRPARANFRNESKADIKRPTIHVRFTRHPEADIRGNGWNVCYVP
jgi:hypothetical protein